MIEKEFNELLISFKVSLTLTPLNTYSKGTPFTAF